MRHPKIQSQNQNQPPSESQRQVSPWYHPALRSAPQFSHPRDGHRKGGPPAHIIAAKNASSSSASAGAYLQLQGDLVIGGLGQGLPVAANNVFGKGLAGAATDAVVNAATKPSSLLSLTGAGAEVAEEGLAASVGFAKIGIDGLIFGASFLSCRYGH